MSRLPKLFLVVLTLALLASLTTPALAADTAKGKIKTVFPDKDELLLTDARGQDWLFNIGQGTKMFVNGKAARLNDFKVGDLVTIIYTKSGNRFVPQEIRSGVDEDRGTTQGQLRSVTADKNQFVLTDTDGKNWTFMLADGAKITVNNRASQLQDLKAGDLVRVTYEKRDGTLFAQEIRTVAK